MCQDCAVHGRYCNDAHIIQHFPAALPTPSCRPLCHPTAATAQGVPVSVIDDEYSRATFALSDKIQQYFSMVSDGAHRAAIAVRIAACMTASQKQGPCRYDYCTGGTRTAHQMFVLSYAMHTLSAFLMATLAHLACAPIGTHSTQNTFALRCAAHTT